MCSQIVTLTEARFTSDVIDRDLFGANAVFTRDFLDEGGAYDRMLQQVGFSGLRYPGGTVVEELLAPGNELVERLFDVTRPSGLSDNGEPRILTAPAAFDYALENGLSLDFTYPTVNYLTDEVGEDGQRFPSPFGLYRLLDRADEIIRLSYGELDQKIFEIGNEFWYRDERMSPEEYGAIANDVAVGAQALFDFYEHERGGEDAWTQPLISVQSAPGWLAGANGLIFDQMSLAAREAIDAVTTHYYPSGYAGASLRQSHFDKLHDWQDLEGVDKELDYFISEWNINNSGDDMGLAHASSMLEIMRVMLENGVDHAAVWGTQYFNLDMRLAKLWVDPDAPGGLAYTLTPAGEVFRMMSEDIRGLQVLDLDTPETLRDAIGTAPEDRAPEDAEQLVMHAFGNADTTIVFLSSRSDVPMEVTLDPSGLLPSYHHVWAERLGVIDDPATGDIDEGDPLSRLARPYIDTLNETELGGEGGLTLTLQPYEIVQFEFTTGDIGVEMSGHDQVVDPAADYDDELGGTKFDDVITGHAGADTLRGNAGDDTLSGGVGDDFLGGWHGDDLLNGGDGNDKLVGGLGNDTLIAGGGENELRGGEGIDQYIVDISGATVLVDFNIDGGEGLSFRDHYDEVGDVLSRTSVDGDDLVIDHDGDGMTRLAGLGGRADDLEGILTDFQEDSPVGDLVDELNTPPPDGEIAPDPPPSFEPPPAFSEDRLEEFLNFDTPGQISDMIGGLSAEEESSFLDQLNANALALSAPQDMWGALCDSLSDAGFAQLNEDLDQDILDIRYLRLAAEQYENGPDDLAEEDGLPISRMFGEVSESVRTEYYLSLSEAERGELEQYWADLNPEEDEWSAAEILMVDPEAAEERRQELQDNDEAPKFAAFLTPGTYKKDDPDDDDDDDEEEDDGSSGGGCFVATCAYGGADHPDVLFLRVYRDLELSGHRGGRAFIAVYYTVGPWLAAAIRPFPGVRRLVRAALGQLVMRMRMRMRMQMRMRMRMRRA